MICLLCTALDAADDDGVCLTCWAMLAGARHAFPVPLPPTLRESIRARVSEAITVAQADAIATRHRFAQPPTSIDVEQRAPAVLIRKKKDHDGKQRRSRGS